jgi:hypothetical protein
MNNIFYGHAPIIDGLFIMNLESERNVYNINAKCRKTNDMNFTYLWHCQLGHIGHKCMKKLHQDVLLQSLNFESFDTCEACLIGKMAKTPFNGFVERASDLLERDFYFCALRSLVVLSFPQLVSFSSVFPKPLSKTLRSSIGREFPLS